ncbi:hypothetical protein [Streptomyces sp. G1]|uniref:hypothetical protein n=1 Tax=Streptomyces sp. G1 TaxID=361572 RepID=UPI00202DCB43|nr:hypothetical protein [Streptomyces sp. G1]MCM1967975.1 hypothetical protein [Streptomyces sp. G1]
MTHHTGRASQEAYGLYTVAHEFEQFQQAVAIPSVWADLPDLVHTSNQLQHLSALIADVSGEVLFRAVDDSPDLDLGPVIYAYTSALVPAGRAMASLTESAEQVGFLHRFAEAPSGTPGLKDARETAFHVVQERLEAVREDLGEVSRSLRGSADRLDGTPPRTLAALSRSARPMNSVYRVPAERPASAPTRLAYTPAPRHGR